MDAGLADGRAFMAGRAPGLVDALCYHLVWFVRGRYSGGAGFLARFPLLGAWEERVKAIGHGNPTEMGAAEALDVAAGARPAAGRRSDPDDRLRPGEPVTVVPEGIEGAPAVAGRIVGVDPQTITVGRADGRVGDVAVHFPRVGYRVRPG